MYDNNGYDLSRSNAIAEMKKGNKVTHVCFSDNEWMSMSANKIVTEEGYRHDPEEFWRYRQLEVWNSGYKLFESK